MILHHVIKKSKRVGIKQKKRDAGRDEREFEVPHCAGCGRLLAGEQGKREDRERKGSRRMVEKVRAKQGNLGRQEEGREDRTR